MVFQLFLQAHLSMKNFAKRSISMNIFSEIIQEEGKEKTITKIDTPPNGKQT